MAEPDLKATLIADLERARAGLAVSGAALRRDLDLDAHFKASFHEHKSAYIGGATLLGLIISKLPARKKKVYVEKKSGKSKETIKEAEKAGIWLVLLQFLFSTLRPVLTKFLSKQVTNFVKSRARTDS